MRRSRPARRSRATGVSRMPLAPSAARLGERREVARAPCARTAARRRRGAIAPTCRAPSESALARDGAAAPSAWSRREAGGARSGAAPSRCDEARASGAMRAPASARRVGGRRAPRRPRRRRVPRSDAATALIARAGERGRAPAAAPPTRTERALRHASNMTSASTSPSGNARRRRSRNRISPAERANARSLREPRSQRRDDGRDVADAERIDVRERAGDDVAHAPPSRRSASIRPSVASRAATAASVASLTPRNCRLRARGDLDPAVAAVARAARRSRACSSVSARRGRCARARAGRRRVGIGRSAPGHQPLTQRALMPPRLSIARESSTLNCAATSRSRAARASSKRSRDAACGAWIGARRETRARARRRSVASKQRSKCRLGRRRRSSAAKAKRLSSVSAISRRAAMAVAHLACDPARIGGAGAQHARDLLAQAGAPRCARGRVASR